MPTFTGRPATRIKAQVFAEETNCWLCGQHVDQTLPPNHNRARSVDHVVPRSKGGNPHDRTNCRLAHRSCNSKRGNRAPRQTNPRSVNW